MSPWEMLGIAPTDDAADIRRAYARKLKALDVDEEPAAFMELREALDCALADAAWGEARRQAGELVEADGPGQDWLDDDASMEGPAEPLAFVGPAEEGEGSERFALLDRLLFGEEGGPAPASDELTGAVRAILDHPDMEQIDHAARVEDWLAAILYDSVPRSDPVIGMVIDHFSWERNEGQLSQLWMADEIIRRRRAFGLIDQVSEPRHELHKAYLDLTSEEPKLGWKTMGRSSQVGRLLTTIRTTAPAAEDCLSPHRVALWDEKLNRSVSGSLKWIMMVCWILFVLAKTTSFFDPASSGPDASARTTPVASFRVFTEPWLDLDPLVEEAAGGGLKLEDIQQRNPPLHDELVRRWEAARAEPRVSGASFSQDVEQILERAAREGLRGGSTLLQVDYWRLRVDELNWLRRDVDACDRYLRGFEPIPEMPSGFGSRRREILQNALRQARPGAPAPLPPGARHSFTIPPAVAAEAIRRADMNPNQIAAALTERGTADQHCRARIALIEAALALPKSQTSQLLRDMSRGL